MNQRFLRSLMVNFKKSAANHIALGLQGLLMCVRNIIQPKDNHGSHLAQQRPGTPGNFQVDAGSPEQKENCRLISVDFG
jgi:hypothetical protein